MKKSLHTKPEEYNKQIFNHEANTAKIFGLVIQPKAIHHSRDEQIKFLDTFEGLWPEQKVGQQMESIE